MPEAKFVQDTYKGDIVKKRIIMSAIELRAQIINQISSIEDEMILKEIYDLIKIESEIDSFYKVTNAEKAAIEAGLKDIESGKIVSSEEANDLIKKWLKK
ncbi:hypothetical protein [Ohtaekwangia sp.]|uniref:hypothetical protein n=1 Tax=Ohtaekwangia sp. TaxID=2066019 RepID=UPI002F933813